MLSTNFIKFLESGTAGIIQLNRPKALNALNFDMWSNIFNLLLNMEHQKDVIIFKGSGKIFCVGGDIKLLSNCNTEQFHQLYTKVYRTFDLIANYKKPYAVLMDGLALGGAAVHSIPGKYRIATERTAFSMPETSIGYFNDAGASYFLSRLDKNFGVYMGMTGTAVKGFDTKKLGLATHFIESHKLEEVEKTLIMCKTHEDVEKVLNEFSSHPTTTTTELDHFLPTIEKCFSGVSVEEIYENLHRDGSDWTKKTLATLNQKSPMALKVTHRSITTGRNLSLRDCLKMEMRLAINHSKGSDLTEGVRAVLIQKDLKPKWSRNSIYDVTDEDVEKFFGPIPEEYELRFEENLKNKL